MSAASDGDWRGEAYRRGRTSSSLAEAISAFCNPMRQISRSVGSGSGGLGQIGGGGAGERFVGSSVNQRHFLARLDAVAEVHVKFFDLPRHLCRHGHFFMGRERAHDVQRAFHWSQFGACDAHGARRGFGADGF